MTTAGGSSQQTSQPNTISSISQANNPSMPTLNDVPSQPGYFRNHTNDQGGMISNSTTVPLNNNNNNDDGNPMPPDIYIPVEFFFLLSFSALLWIALLWLYCKISPTKYLLRFSYLCSVDSLRG